MKLEISPIVAFMVALLMSLACVSPVSAADHATVTFTTTPPCNLFDASSPVKIEADLKDFESGHGSADVSVLDYFGNQIWKSNQPVSVGPGESSNIVCDPKNLPPGYYEITANVHVDTANGNATEASGKASFGIVHFVNRTAEETRTGGFRFGVKKWNFGRAPWLGNIEWSEDETIGACSKLGLQWTRELFNLKEHLGTVEMIQKYPMNVVLKVERFPAELFDADRYGSMKQWEAKYGVGAWTLKTLPKEAPYKNWLREQIREIPPSQKVFEIWNEAWDKMSPEDFAILCQWVADVVLDVRPDAVIGPNLLGETSEYQFDARLIKAGGMKRMNMVALHPYGKSEDRAWLRNYRQWLRESIGRDVDIYVTEFGSDSTPEGPARRTEREQARIVVRQALALYSEGVTVFMPHTMGQAERNPTYIEDWFGMFRFNRQPKPVIIAYANAANLIDGGRYVGDLWYGPGVEAMLFEKSGTFVVALQTRGEKKSIKVQPGVAELTVVDMVGTPTKRAVKDGVLDLTVDADVTYLVGVNPELEKSATKELRPDRWPTPAKPPRTSRIAHRLKSVPKFDGKLDEWKDATQLALLNPKVNPEDGSGFAFLGWDDDALYVAVQIRDNEVLNTRPRSKLYQQDSIELFVSTEPRDQNSGYGPHDHQYFVTPTSGEGKAIFGEVTDHEAGRVEDVAGAKFFAGKASPGWVAEVAVPWSSLAGFTPKPGAKLALEVRLNDADAAHDRFKIDPIDGNVQPPDPTAWSFLVLEN